MKKLIFSAVLIAFVIASCNHKSKEAETHNPEMMSHDSTMMDRNHKMMDSSSRMMNHDSTMMDHNSKMMNSNSKMYACPMHPEVMGKKGDKCIKCGMKLTEDVKK